MTDREGRTPLHYAAVAKGSGATYDTLLQHGALENVLDKVQAFQTIDNFTDVLHLL